MIIYPISGATGHNLNGEREPTRTFKFRVYYSGVNRE
jgi:hypothetical protein